MQHPEKRISSNANQRLGIARDATSVPADYGHQMQTMMKRETAQHFGVTKPRFCVKHLDLAGFIYGKDEFFGPPWDLRYIRVCREIGDTPDYIFYCRQKK